MSKYQIIILKCLVIGLMFVKIPTSQGQEMPSKKKELEDAYQQHTQQIASLKSELAQMKEKVENLEADKRKLGYEKDGLIQDLNSLDYKVVDLKKIQDSLSAELLETQNQLEINLGINQQLKSLLETLTASQASQEDSVATNFTQNETTVPLYLGSFVGTQPESVIKDQDGKEMVINGQKIKTPPIGHTFTIMSDNKVMLEQVNENDQSITKLSGTYTIKTDNEQVYEMACKLKNDQDLVLDYMITINKLSEEITCSLKDQAPFKLLKNILVENIGEVTSE
ncbi:hypothetical protein KZP23_01380 [Echinicola marina]|uniref:hypothetical protein n=1 Tax=Echinicola marina TaxID=2859768 RepID=UPI001CF70643|nr:hypothetical protein [Echinicola marina]UCS93718.1 hypothetical protein KZP23_01380 [Echinicola marina]